MDDYQVAEQMANNTDQLINMFRTADNETMRVMCGHIANCFRSFTDEEVSREETQLQLLIEINHLHSEIVENIFLPRLQNLRRAA